MFSSASAPSPLSWPTRYESTPTAVRRHPHRLSIVILAKRQAEAGGPVGRKPHSRPHHPSPPEQASPPPASRHATLPSTSWTSSRSSSSDPSQRKPRSQSPTSASPPLLVPKHLRRSRPPPHPHDHPAPAQPAAPLRESPGTPPAPHPGGHAPPSTPSSPSRATAPAAAKAATAPATAPTANPAAASASAASGVPRARLTRMGPRAAAPTPAPPPPFPPPPAPAPAPPPSSQLGCRHFGACSGCSLQDQLAAPPLYGEAREFFRGLGLEHVPAVMKAAHGWRCRAKLAVRGAAGRPLIGLFREGTHQCVDIVGEPQPLPVSSTESTAGAGGAAGPGSRARAPGVAAGVAAESGAGLGLGRSRRREEDAAGLMVRQRGHQRGEGHQQQQQRSGGGGALCSEAAAEAEGSCRAHHPRINEAAALIKQLVAKLGIQPYNEPLAVNKGKARPAGGRPSAAAGRSTAPPSTINTGDAGLLRYVQLTAVPSQPGGRAEEDSHAAVQVVLVLNAPPDCDPETDPRVAPIMNLCRRLWRLAGPPGRAMEPPAAAAAEPPLPTDSDPSPLAAPVLDDDPVVWRGSFGSNGAPTSSSPSLRPPSPPLLHSLWLNFQDDASRNAVLGAGWRHVAGPAAAWQEFGGVAACVGPGSFVQANYGAMQLVLREIAEMVPPGSRVTELHAGIGVIGLSLAARRHLATLRLVEVNPAAAGPFHASLEQLRRRRWHPEEEEQPQQRPTPPPPQDHQPTGSEPAVSRLPPVVEYITAEAGSDPARFLAGCDVLVVDPPRKGLGQSLLTALTAQPPAPLSPRPSPAPRAPSTAASPTTTPTAAAAAAEAGVPAASEACPDPPEKLLGPERPGAGAAAPLRAAAAAAVCFQPWKEGSEAVSGLGGSVGGSGDGVGFSGSGDGGGVSGGGGTALPSRLVYLSCGFRALQGDLAALLAGGWRLVSATAYLFFPGTDSLETLVLLTRGEGDQEQGVRK